MLSDLLRPLAPDVASHFTSVASPIALLADSSMRSWDAGAEIPDLEGRTTALLVGPLATRCAPAVHSLAEHLGAPVANTWGAKGIYPWDNPHHMGTCGLQRDDFTLLGFADIDVVIAVGLDPLESPDELLALTTVVPLLADDTRLSYVESKLPRGTLANEPNELYTRISGIAQPGYTDDSFPRHPARAVMDLKQSLGPSTRVTAQPGLAGLWVARTFPTDRMGSVIVPAHDRPGIGAAVGLVSAAQGTDTVCVVQGPVDDITREIMTVATHHELPLRLEVWEDDVNWDRTQDLIAAAGPVVAWT